MKKMILNGLCILFFVTSVILLLVFQPWKRDDVIETFHDGIENIDPNTIELKDNRVEVDFSEILLSAQNETRNLIVSEQTGKVSVQLTSKMIALLDWEWLEKKQTVSYEGCGYFVVDLDKITKECILDDKENKIVTIKIDHAYLKAIEIDPNRIIVDEVEEGLFARGDIKLPVQDYNTIEKEIRERLQTQFDTAENGQKADEIAIESVQKIYEPIVKAIDPEYRVLVEFQSNVSDASVSDGGKKR